MQQMVDVKGESSLKELLGCQENVVLYFWSKETCTGIDPLVAQLCVDTPQARFFQVEAEKQPEIEAMFDVPSTPFFLFLKDGKVVDRLEGTSPSELANKVSKLAGPRTSTTAAAPASLGMAGGPVTIETVQQELKN